MRVPSAFAVIGLLVGSQAVAQTAAAFLFDVLKRPEYDRAWRAMLSGQRNLPRWLSAYDQKFDGPATPGREIRIDGKTYEAFHVCEAHNCSQSEFEVIFPGFGASAAKGLLLSGGDVRLFGSPTPAEAKALLKAVND